MPPEDTDDSTKRRLDSTERRHDHLDERLRALELLVAQLVGGLRMSAVLTPIITASLSGCIVGIVMFFATGRARP